MLAAAEAEVGRLSAALAADPTSLQCRRLLFSAEQALLLVRVAADSGARRGELAALRVTGSSTPISRVPKAAVQVPSGVRTRTIAAGIAISLIRCSTSGAERDERPARSGRRGDSGPNAQGASGGGRWRRHLG